MLRGTAREAAAEFLGTAVLIGFGSAATRASRCASCELT